MLFDLHLLEKGMKSKHDEEDDRNDAMLPFHQQFYFHQQQQQQQRKRECLSDEVDSARSRGDQTKKPRIDAEQQAELKTLALGGGGGGGPDGASIEVAKRRRGRPPGSRNRPKPPAVIQPGAAEQPPPPAGAGAAAAMSPHVLEIPAGHDVADSLARFARRRNLGICILAGTGAVANVVLRQPHFGGGAPPPPSTALTVGFHGRFEILSISATFLPAAMAALAPGISGEMSISLAGPQGQVVGGTVAGPLMAAGTVVVVAAAFSNPTFHRLPVEDDVPISVSVSGGGESEEPPPPPPQQINHQRQPHQHQHATPAVPAAESCGMSIYSGHISSDVIWAAPPTSRPLPPPPY